ncbi:MmcB family DNA repair protein [Loktanella fryxellensis]|nr:MmcB family DNA repair protein [Loktanella fryxellensis]
MMDDAILPVPTPLLTPGQLLARGVARHLRGHDFVSVVELVPAPGLRVDVMALGPKGEVWIVECKSSVADYRADAKWQGYLPWCDRFFWAVGPAFPTDLLPEGSGLMIADSYDAEIVAMGDATPLAPPRRKAMIQAIARHAAVRAQAARDPGFVLPFGG